MLDRRPELGLSSAQVEREYYPHVPTCPDPWVPIPAS
jgi:hypothetical protein